MASLKYRLHHRLLQPPPPSEKRPRHVGTFVFSFCPVLLGSPEYPGLPDMKQTQHAAAAAATEANRLDGSSEIVREILPDLKSLVLFLKRHDQSCAKARVNIVELEDGDSKEPRGV